MAQTSVATDTAITETLNPNTKNPSTDPTGRDPVIVVGGGVAGLVAAVELAHGGARVVLFDQAPHLGGRAITQEISGYRFNLGPRALYRGGHARRILDELGISYVGHRPPLDGALAFVGGQITAFPITPQALIGAHWLGLRGRFEVARLSQRLPRIDPDAWRGQPLREWLHRSCQHPNARRFFEAFVRLTTYASDLDTLDAGAVIRQLQIGMDPGVLYLDGGWQTLVDGLARAASEAGVELRHGQQVRGLRFESAGRDRVCGVELADGTGHRAAAVVLAVGPGIAQRLAGEAVRIPMPAGPVHAACLDVGLGRLPRPDRLFALGIDVPMYYSVHSASARLAPAGGTLVHVLCPVAEGGEAKRQGLAERLEGALEQLQPGWREVLAERRFMPRMLVTHGLPAWDRPLPPSVVDGVEGLRLAGDWVAGPESDPGMLADASAASGRRSARDILHRLAKPARLAA